MEKFLIYVQGDDNIPITEAIECESYYQAERYAETLVDNLFMNKMASAASYQVNYFDNEDADHQAALKAQNYEFVQIGKNNHIVVESDLE